MQTTGTRLRTKLWPRIGLGLFGLAIVVGLYRVPALWNDLNRPCRALDNVFKRSGCLAAIPFQDLRIPMGSRPHFVDRDTVRIVGVERRDGKQRPVFLEISASDAKITRRTPTNLWLVDGHLSAMFSPKGDKVLLTAEAERKGNWRGILLLDWDGSLVARLEGSERVHTARTYFLAPEATFRFEEGTVGRVPSTAVKTGIPPVWSLADGRLLQGQPGEFPGVSLWPRKKRTIIVWAGADHNLAMPRRTDRNPETGHIEGQLFSVDQQSGQHRPIGTLRGIDSEEYFVDVTPGGEFLAFQKITRSPDWGVSVVKTSNLSEVWSAIVAGYFQHSIGLSDDGSRLAVVLTVGKKGRWVQQMQVFDTGFGPRRTTR